MPKLLNITNEAIIDVMETGMTLKEGAEVLGCSKETLAKRIAKIQNEQGILLKYRQLQSLHLTQLQSRILEAITPDKIATAELKDLVLAYKVLKDKELNLDGKPSEIKGLVSYLVQLENERISGTGTETGVEVLPSIISDSIANGEGDEVANGVDESIFDVKWE